MRRLRALLWLVLLSMSVHAQAPARPSIVFTRATVIDVINGQAVPGTTVIVSGDRIVAMGPSERVETPSGAHVIDAAGKYLIPGLWDMHVHLGAGGDPTALDMPLMIANGVTGVREMWSDCFTVTPVDCLAQRREWQRQVETGATVGPRVLALASWPVNGPDGPAGGMPRGVPEFFAATTDAQARQLARYFAERKVDFIKVYPRISREGFFGLADEAKRLGLSIAGHEVSAVSAIEASDAGQRSFEHARVFLYTCFPGAAEFSRTTGAPNHGWRRRMVDEHDAGACERVFRVFVRNGTRYVPTHITRKLDTLVNDPALKQNAQLKYVRKPIVASWNASVDGLAERYTSEPSRQSVKDLYTKGLEITGAAHRAGVQVLLGTDTGDTYVIPGFAVHDELEELVKAGLTPADALRAGTWRAAEFMQRTADTGSIAAGKLADLVVLDANPLADIRRTRAIAGVMVNGRYLDRTALDALLTRAEAAARQ